MIQTSHSTPRSIVLRSTHILLVKVIAAKEGAWVPSKPGFKSRTVDLSLEISETLRGKVDPVPGEPVRVTIPQSDYDGELMMQPVPGSWSRVPLEPGTELVVFAESRVPRAEQVLAEPACTRVVPAEPVLPGLHIAAKAEADRLPLAATLELAAPDTARLDPMFAEFLWDKYGDGALASQVDFDLLADFAERKGLDARTRQELLDGGYRLVGLHGDPTPGRARRLALAMCRVLLMAEAADLHENLIGTYLPNLLGITSGLPLQPAWAVFKDREAERDALDAFLRGHGTDADATPLLAWLSVKRG
jgi:hypothetical protein